MKKFLIINTGIGNFEAIRNVLNYIGYSSKISGFDENFDNYNYLIIPGVGNFDNAISFLKKHNDFSKLTDKKFLENKKIFGICVGMQVLFESSEEGKSKGLSLIPGGVKKFNNSKLRVPHMGWNKVHGDDIDFNMSEKKFYFAHSYYVDCDDKYVKAYCNYTHKFPAYVKSNNIYGIQFHPEKSSINGIEFLKNLISGF